LQKISKYGIIKRCGDKTPSPSLLPLFVKSKIFFGKFLSLCDNETMSKEKIAFWLLKLAVAFPLIYVSWREYVNPSAWQKYIPNFLDFIGSDVFIWIMIVFQVVIAALIIFTPRPAIASLVALVYFILIIIFNARWNQPSFDIFFRDISLCLATASLAIKSRSFY
jgi:hypothetical protein